METKDPKSDGTQIPTLSLGHATKLNVALFCLTHMLSFKQECANLIEHLELMPESDDTKMATELKKQNIAMLRRSAVAAAGWAGFLALAGTALTQAAFVLI